MNPFQTMRPPRSRRPHFWVPLGIRRTRRAHVLRAVASALVVMVTSALFVLVAAGVIHVGSR